VSKRNGFGTLARLYAANFLPCDFLASHRLFNPGRPGCNSPTRLPASHREHGLSYGEREFLLNRLSGGVLNNRRQNIGARRKRNHFAICRSVGRFLENIHVSITNNVSEPKIYSRQKVTRKMTGPGIDGLTR
jgi:hypothetical protein